jgi:hypothetical protein
MQTSVGVDYSFMHDQARDDSFSAAVHSIQGRYILQIGPAWTVDIGGGVFIADVNQKVVFLDPALSAIFGATTFVVAPLETRKTGPSGALTISRRFKRSVFSINGSRSVMSGAGTYVTSLSESGGISYTYTAARRWSFNLRASDVMMRGIGTSLGKYNAVAGGTGFTYEIFPSLHLTANYDIRHLDVTQTGYVRNPSSASIGLTFSPGTLPLSFR